MPGQAYLHTLGPQAISYAKEIPRQNSQYHKRRQDNRNTNGSVRFSHADHGIPDAIYKIEKRVEFREGLEPWRQHSNRVEHAAQKTQRHYNKRIEYIELLKTLRPKTDEKTYKREQNCH